MNRASKTTSLLAASLALALAWLPRPAAAGAYVFAGETNGIDIVTHPTGYDGTGGHLFVTVCVDPTSANAASMEIPVQNAVNTYNCLRPKTGNLLLGASNNVPAGTIDFQSAVLHELGHCIGLAHPNLASESGLGSPLNNGTKTTNGLNNVFNTNAGTDAIHGSSDDIRGDDDNLHWFQKGVNNPFASASVVDSSTFSRDLADLPAGQTFAANGDRTVSTLYAIASTEAVMQQGQGTDEDQRGLTADDVDSLRFAMAGVDEVAGTADDYGFTLVYGGLTTVGCDVVIDFDNSQTGFAVCQTGGSFVGGHVAITSANIFYNTGASWFFNTDPSEDIFCDRFDGGDFQRWSATVP